MVEKISQEKIQAFLQEKAFPAHEDWGPLLHCLYGKQSCPNLSETQQQQIRSLLLETMSGSTFTAPAFSETVVAMDRILNAPYIKELQLAIEETTSLIHRFKETSGRQLDIVDDLEKLTIKTVLSDKTPQQMVAELKGAFGDLVTLMVRDVENLENLCKTDQLTGLANRRGFDEYLQRYCQPEMGEGLYLLMIDIDYFKQFNDEFGHLVGDEVLALVASLVDKAAKSKHACRYLENLAARYGGEEFAIIIPFCSDEFCLQLAETLRTRIEQYPVVIRSSEGKIIKRDVHLTVSIGVAAMHPLWLSEENSSHQLLQAADQALYEAKKRGRNMTCQHKAYRADTGEMVSMIL